MLGRMFKLAKIEGSPVSKYMTAEPITFFEDEALSEIMLLFDPKVFSHLPIVNRQQELVGIISHKDLFNLHQLLGPGTDTGLEARKKTIQDIMSRDLATVAPVDKLSYAISLMVEKHVNALPVLNESSLVGIITSTDILRAYANRK